jgi:hypothetical protein
MKIYVGCIDHRHGRNWYVAETKKELFAQIAVFCRSWWGEVTLLEKATIPKSDRAVVEQYFAAREDETWEYGCEKLPLPAAAVEALTHSTTQLKDLANGWAHGELHEPLADTIKRNEKIFNKEKA